jgi:hypothetical protein
MSRRSDSNIDLDKYQPSLDDLQRAADEDAAQARLRKALDNPALDAALLELRGEPVTPPTEASTSPAAPHVPEDKPSLRTKGAPAAPPVTSRIVPARRGARPKDLSLWSKVLGSIVLAFVPAMIMYVLFVRPHPSDPARPAASASSTVAPRASAPTSSAVAPAPASATGFSPAPEITAPPSAASSVAPSPVPRPPSTTALPNHRHPPNEPSAAATGMPAPTVTASAPTLVPSAPPPEPPPLPKFF